MSGIKLEFPRELPAALIFADVRRASRKRIEIPQPRKFPLCVLRRSGDESRADRAEPVHLARSWSSPGSKEALDSQAFVPTECFSKEPRAEPMQIRDARRHSTFPGTSGSSFVLNRQDRALTLQQLAHLSAFSLPSAGKLQGSTFLQC